MMNGLEVSLHAGQRMRQRGIRSSDISLVLDYGTQIDGQCFLLMEKDAARAIRKRKQEIQALERLCGMKVVVSENVIVTCYQATRKHIKRAFRRSR